MTWTIRQWLTLPNIAIGFTLLQKSKLYLCEGYIFYKLSNSPFPSHPKITVKVLQLVYMNIYGPIIYLLKTKLAQVSVLK